MNICFAIKRVRQTVTDSGYWKAATLVMFGCLVYLLVFYDVMESPNAGRRQEIFLPQDDPWLIQIVRFVFRISVSVSR